VSAKSRTFVLTEMRIAGFWITLQRFAVTFRDLEEAGLC
jgi:hypothetical protein